jgi:hypothetical protein
MPKISLGLGKESNFCTYAPSLKTNFFTSDRPTN